MPVAVVGTGNIVVRATLGLPVVDECIVLRRQIEFSDYWEDRRKLFNLRHAPIFDPAQFQASGIVAHVE